MKPLTISFLHLIYVPMTGVGLYGGYRGYDWYQERIRIFKEYTLKSLLNQENRKFILWMSFRPEEKNNRLTAELANYLKSKKIEYILTFDGLMYWDDKYTPEISSRLKNFARIIRGCLRNGTWGDLWSSTKELWYDKNKTLKERLSRSLSIIEKYFSNVDWVYITRIDSDDMFHKSMVKEIQQMPPFCGAYVVKNGYIHNSDTGEFAEYNPKTNPPFHTIVFPSYIFFNAQEYLDYFGEFRSHEDTTKVFNSLPLTDYRYCVLTHNPANHISTIWNHPFRGKVIEDRAKCEQITKDFGING